MLAEPEPVLVGSRRLIRPETTMPHFAARALTRMKGGVFGGALGVATFCLVSAAAAQAPAASQDAPPKQVALSQKSLDGLVNAQKQIRAVEAKASPGKNDGEPDAKTEAKIESIAKANGFATMNDFADASYSVGLVLAGMDPATKTYIGAQAALKKQVADVQADKSMPPKEKTEALAELKAAIADAPTEKPLPGNIDAVKANFDKLNEGAEGAGGAD